MGSKKQKKTGEKKRQFIRQHTISIFAISGVIVLMTIMLAFGSISLQEKNKRYQRQEKELQVQMKREEERREEIEEFEAYSKTDAYVEDVAKDKLGLRYANEILFEAEP